jgi:hypothetical protein
MHEHGSDLTAVTPRALDLTHRELSDLHVIVSLDGPVSRYLDEVPFHSVAMEWDLPEIAPGSPDEEALPALESAYREIAVQMRDLMHLLRGEGAT